MHDSAREYQTVKVIELIHNFMEEIDKAGGSADMIVTKENLDKPLKWFIAHVLAPNNIRFIYTEPNESK